MPLYEDATDLAVAAERLRARRHGMIEMVAGRLARVVLRPWMRRASLAEIQTVGRLQHRWQASDRCRVYYSQPWGMPTYLAVTYAISGRRTSLASIRGAAIVLDEIARLRRADALVCELANARISDRLLVRWGWAPLNPANRRRQFIKRFYGCYPPPKPLPLSLCTPRGATLAAAVMAASVAGVLSEESSICTHTTPSWSLTG